MFTKQLVDVLDLFIKKDSSSIKAVREFLCSNNCLMFLYKRSLSPVCNTVLPDQIEELLNKLECNLSSRESTSTSDTDNLSENYSLQLSGVLSNAGHESIINTRLIAQTV